MLIGSHDTNERVLIVAEIGNNHEGDVSVAEELIARAAECGADAVKFQTLRPECLVRPTDAERLARLRAFALSRDDFVHLAECASRAGVLFLSTPLDLNAVDDLEPLVAAYKIASGDNDFLPLLERVAQTRKPVVLSCGLASLTQLQHAVAWLRHHWRQADPGLAALHCVSGYPVPPEQANLSAISTLRSALDCTVGYSDHTIGIEAAVLAVAAGARIVEKHFTLDHDYSEFRDHKLSADPVELAELVRRIRHAERLLGSGEKTVQPCEWEGAVAFRRSIAVRCDLPAGHVLCWDDLVWLRPGGGLRPGCEAQVIGRVLRTNVTAGTPIDPEMLAPAAERACVASV